MGDGGWDQEVPEERLFGEPGKSGGGEWVSCVRSRLLVNKHKDTLAGRGGGGMPVCCHGSDKGQGDPVRLGKQLRTQQSPRNRSTRSQTYGARIAKPGANEGVFVPGEGHDVILQLRKARLQTILVAVDVFLGHVHALVIELPQNLRGTKYDHLMAQ